LLSRLVTESICYLVLLVLFC